MATHSSILAWRIPWTESPLGYKASEMTEFGTSLVAQTVKSLAAMWDTQVRSLGWEDPLEEERATHSSIFAWRISWTEEHGRL